MSFQVARWNERLELFYWSWRRFCYMGWWKQRQEILKYSEEGLLPPEDLFNKETKIVCCSTTGSASEDITLPDKAPFLLFAYDSLPCQRVSLSNRKLKSRLYLTQNDLEVKSQNQSELDIYRTYVERLDQTTVDRFHLGHGSQTIVWETVTFFVIGFSIPYTASSLTNTKSLFKLWWFTDWTMITLQIKLQIRRSWTAFRCPRQAHRGWKLREHSVQG